MEISWQRRFVSFLFSSTCIFKKKLKTTSQVKKILILEWAYLGDIITASPSFELLRNEFPNAEITLVTSPSNKEYINENPALDNIIYLPNPLHFKRSTFLKSSLLKTIKVLRENKYCAAIELTGRLNNQFFMFFVKANVKVGEDPTGNFTYLHKRITSPSIHEVDRNIGVASLLFKSERKRSFPLWNPVKEIDHEFVNAILLNNKIDAPFAVVHIKASWEPKQWGYAKWKETLIYLSKLCQSIVFIGSEAEREVIDVFIKNYMLNVGVNLAGMLKISETIALMQDAELFLGNDSGPMHMAAIAGLKGIVLFGPSDAEKWGYNIHRIVSMKPICSPCPQIPNKERCIKGLKECIGLSEIKAADVISEIEILLKH